MFDYIKQNWDNIEAWYVFADWLQGRGGVEAVLGELTAVELAIEGGDSRDRLLSRKRELTEELTGLVGSNGVQFKYGIVESVLFRSIDDAVKFQQSKELLGVVEADVKLNLWNNQISDISPLKDLNN